MLAAPTLDDVLRRAEVYGSPHPLCDRLVSIVFASPAALVVTGLESNRRFWDEESGDGWDLFFAGYYSFGSHGDPDPIYLDARSDGEGAWEFSPRRFTEFVRDVEHGMARAHLPEAWRFSGDADVVSLMVYGGEPDWLSLRAVKLCDPSNADGAPTLGSVIEGLRRWQDEEPDADLAPGESPLGPLVPVGGLRDVLLWSAGTVAGGILGNRADAILSHLLR